MFYWLSIRQTMNHMPKIKLNIFAKQNGKSFVNYRLLSWSFLDFGSQCDVAIFFCLFFIITDWIMVFLFACNLNCRIKKLIDIEALGLSRLSVILLDIHTDVKGYSLLTLPQVRFVDELTYKFIIIFLTVLFHFDLCLSMF